MAITAPLCGPPRGRTRLLATRLRGLLKALRPGFYLNKGTITSQGDLAARLRELLWYLAGRGR